jgi:Tfp pilus assembly protein PilF
VKTADLEKANTTNDQMTKWSKTAVPTQLCAEFRRALRQAHVEAALRAKPDDAQALADYGRVMIDLGRWDEAGQSLRKAAQINPNLPGVQWDLHYALLQASGGKQTAGTNFEEALKVAEAAVAPAEGKQERTRDFFAWHQLAILLYRKAWMQQTAGDAAAADTRRRCRESLAEALKCGRAAGKVERESLYQPKIVGITGFAFLEANHDYLILEGSRAVEKNPQDYLAWLSLASGLLDLKQYDLAGAALQKCMSIRPDSCQAQYCAGVIALRTGDRGLAARALQDVLRVNPWHPEANLTLAEIYTEEGDTAAAAAYLAAHAQWYGIPPAE